MFVKGKRFLWVVVVEDLSGYAIRQPDQMLAWLVGAALALRFRVLTLGRPDAYGARDHFVHLKGIEVEVAIRV
jgi:hypothetical protein